MVNDADSTTVQAVRILVVEDDPTVAEVVTRYLEREGHEVVAVGDGREALRRTEEWSPDLVVLDLMLPGLDGLAVCRRLRQQGPVPIVMLTARGQESDRILGLELGADDYVAKPFSPRELTLRVSAVLRRARARSAPATPGSEEAVPLIAGDLMLEPHARQVQAQGAPVALTVLEFDLLAFLMRHSRQAFTRQELLAKVWGYEFGDTSTVTVHVRRL
ncbi:MAG: response regulator transcription factor, partial [Actinomycetota bacterium]